MAKAAVHKLDVHQLLFNYLRLLGLDTRAVSIKHRTTFDKNMFLNPNRKAFEIVVHFLFTKLDPERALKEFRDIWPVFDKKQESQFRKTVQAWLIEIQSNASYFPRLNPSILLNPGGDKFCDLLCTLASYVVDRQLINRDDILLHPECKKGGKPKNCTSKIIASVMNEHFSSFATDQATFFAEYTSKKRLANDLIAKYRQSHIKIAQLTQKLEEVKAVNQDLGSKLLNLDDKTICDELLMKTQGNQSVLEDYLNKFRLLESQEKECSKVFDYLFKKKNSPVNCLDGLAILRSIPTEILENYQRKQAMHHKEIQLSEGKVNIVDLMSVILTSVQENYKLPPLPDNIDVHAKRLKNNERGHKALVEQFTTEVTKLETYREKQIKRLDALHDKLAQTVSGGGLGLPPITPYRPLLPKFTEAKESPSELFSMTPAIAASQPLKPAPKLQIHPISSPRSSPQANTSTSSSASPQLQAKSSLSARHYLPDKQKQWQIKKAEQTRSASQKEEVSLLPTRRKYADIPSKINTNPGVIPKRSTGSSKNGAFSSKSFESKPAAKETPVTSKIGQKRDDKLNQAAEDIVSSIVTKNSAQLRNSPLVTGSEDNSQGSFSPPAMECIRASSSAGGDLLQLIDSALSTPKRRTSSSVLRTPSTTPSSRNSSRWFTSSRKNSLTCSEPSATPSSSFLEKRDSLKTVAEQGSTHEPSLDDIIKRLKRVRVPFAYSSPSCTTENSSTPLEWPNMNEDVEHSGSDQANMSLPFDLSMEANLEDIEEYVDVSNILL